MDLINMRNMEEICEFISKLNRGNFCLLSNSFYIYIIWEMNVAARPKFQYNIFQIMPARPNKHRNMRCEYYYRQHVKQGN